MVSFPFLYVCLLGGNLSCTVRYAFQDIGKNSAVDVTGIPQIPSRRLPLFFLVFLRSLPDV